MLVGENYETPVSYWMPFNGNIGLHDAIWRDSFGADIYKKSGSTAALIALSEGERNYMGRSQRERLSSAIIWTERNRSRRSVSRMRKRRRQLLIRSPRSEPLQRTAKRK